MDPIDPLPGLKADIDQVLMLAPDLARIQRTYFEAFQKEGFTEGQALYLTACQMHQSPGKMP